MVVEERVPAGSPFSLSHPLHHYHHLNHRLRRGLQQYYVVEVQYCHFLRQLPFLSRF